MGNLCCGGNGLSIFPLLSHHHVPIEGIPSDDPELATIARLISSSHRRGTEERWSQIDIETRKELTHIENKGKNHGAGEELPTWEDKKPLSAKYLMTKARTRSQFSLYCVMGANLFMTGNLSLLDPFVLETWGNEAAININQDPLGLPHRVLPIDNHTITYSSVYSSAAVKAGGGDSRVVTITECGGEPSLQE